MEDYKKEEWGAWKIVSDMLDKPSDIGIYPTSECYKKLYDFVCEQKKKAKQEERERILKALETSEYLKERKCIFGDCFKQIKDIIKKT